MNKVVRAVCLITLTSVATCLPLPATAAPSDSARKALAKHDYDSALTIVKELLRMNPNDLMAKRYESIALYQQGLISQAIKGLHKCIKQNNTEPLDFYYLGEAYFSSNQYKQAVDAYCHALALDPSLADAYCGLARTYDAAGQAKESEVVRQRAREYGCPVPPGRTAAKSNSKTQIRS